MTDIIATCRRIRNNHQYEMVDGMLLDALTANVIMEVHDGITPERQKSFIELYENHGLVHLVDICFKTIERAQEKAK